MIKITQMPLRAVTIALFTLFSLCAVPSRAAGDQADLVPRPRQHAADQAADRARAEYQNRNV